MWDTVSDMIFYLLALLGLVTLMIGALFLIVSRFCKVEFRIQAGKKIEEMLSDTGAGDDDITTDEIAGEITDEFIDAANKLAMRKRTGDA